MIYYKHNTTGEVIASLNNIREIIDGGNTFKVITDVIMPQRAIELLNRIK